MRNGNPSTEIAQALRAIEQATGRLLGSAGATTVAVDVELD